MTAKVYHGDCLEVMRDFEANGIDLIYLDPPFFTQKTHKLRTKNREKEFTFDDLWSSQTDYAEFLFGRLDEMRRILSPKGSIFFHCDRTAAHIARLLLDEVFGSDMFRAEIIWHYKRWSNTRDALLPAHQNIYHYTKSDDYTFNVIYQDYSATTNVDQILQRRKRDKFGKSVYDIDQEGNVVTSGGKKGVPLGDVWDIPYLNPKAKERTGYPTQKPLLLLERIIKIATDEGDLVLDPFCGSGTTLVAAKLLNRRSIGIDISADAIALTKKRLASPIKTHSQMLEKGRKAYKNADENALALLSGLDYAPVQRNKGIDAILIDDINGRPILIRVQRPQETIYDAAIKLYKAAQKKNARALFVIATSKGGYFEGIAHLPPEIIVINAPSLSITEIVSKLKERG